MKVLYYIFFFETYTDLVWNRINIWPKSGRTWDIHHKQSDTCRWLVGSSPCRRRTKKTRGYTTSQRFTTPTVRVDSLLTYGWARMTRRKRGSGFTGAPGSPYLGRASGEEMAPTEARWRTALLCSPVPSPVAGRTLPVWILTPSASRASSRRGRRYIWRALPCAKDLRSTCSTRLGTTWEGDRP